MLHLFLFAIGMVPSPDDPIVLARPSVLAGLVVDADGRPVPEAEVFLSGSARGDAILHWQGRTDALGRFRAGLPEGVPAPGPYLNLLAYHASRGAARDRVSVLTPQESPVRLVLTPVARMRVRVVDPDGKAVAGARVKAGSATFGLEPPAELARRLNFVTDAEGRMVIEGLASADRPYFHVTAAGFGIQSFSGSVADDVEWTLDLRPVGRVVGRIVAADPAGARGVIVRVGTIAPVRPGDRSAWGSTRAVSDADGRFEIPEVATGRLLISCWPSDLNLIMTSVPGREVEGGGRTDVELMLKKGLPVRGLARERGSGRPIAGVSLSFNSRPDGGFASTQTDALGRFQVFLRPGEVGVNIPTGSPYVIPDGPPIAQPWGLRLASLPDGSACPDLSIDLVRSPDIRGTAHDESGKPVVGAGIEALSLDGRLRVGSRYPNPGPRTDEFGHFVLKGMTPGVRLELMAQRDELASGPPVLVVPESGVSVDLIVSRANALSLGGRVVDERGRPIAGAEVSIRSRSKTQAGSAGSRGTLASDGWTLRTDAEGRFRTPHRLRRHEEHQAFANVAGRMANETIWFVSTTPSFFDLTLYPSFPPEQRSVRSKFDTGWEAMGRGDYATAGAEFDAAIKEAEAKKTGTPLEVGYWLSALAEARLGSGKNAEAETQARRALALVEAELGDAHEEVADILTTIAVACQNLGKSEEAERLLRKALAIRKTAQGPDHPRYAFGLVKLGTFLTNQGQYAEAEAALARAADVIEKTEGADHRDLIDALDWRGFALLQLGRDDEAEPILRRLLPLADRILGGKHATTVAIRDRLVWLLRQTGRQDEANALEALARPSPIHVP
jgi:Flp pilus assembly protein TadD